jgi:hypothetical protein
VKYSLLLVLGIPFILVGAFYLNHDEPYWWYKVFESEGMLPDAISLTEKMSNWTAYFAVLDRGILGLFFDGVTSGLGLIFLLIIGIALSGFALIFGLITLFVPSALVIGIGVFIPKMEKIIGWVEAPAFFSNVLVFSYLADVLGDKFIRYYVMSVWAIILVAGIFFLVKGIIEYRRKKETDDAEKPKKAPALRFIDYYPEELELKFSDGRVLTVGQFIDSSNPLLHDIYAFDFFTYKYINFELLEQFKG